MKNRNARLRTIGVVLTFTLLLIWGCAGSQTGSESTGDTGATTRVKASVDNPFDPERPAAGTQLDSLEACLARIPKDATAGQRMLAESSCEQEKESQKAIEDAP